MQSHPQQESFNSPNAVPLLTLPNATQSDFDALIELLCTDEVAGQDSIDDYLKQSEANRPAHDLRDEDGRLDFTKIKTLFSSGKGIDPRDSITILSSTDKGNQGVNELENAHATKLPDAPVQTSRLSSLVPSQYPVKNIDSHVFESGLPPVAAESTPPAASHRLPRDNLDLIDLSSDAPPWTPGPTNVDAPSLAVPFSYDGLQPITLSRGSPSTLTNTLALAQREAATLRRRVRELEDLIRTYRDQAPTQSERNFEVQDGETLPSFQAPSTENNHRKLNREMGLSHDDPHHSTHIMKGINQGKDLNALSLAQTRFILKSLMNNLALPPSCIPSLLSEDRKVKTLPTSSLEEIYRAVDMVTFVDELVWRRSRTGSVYDRPYSEENVLALRERLELWERIVRTRR